MMYHVLLMTNVIRLIHTGDNHFLHPKNPSGNMAKALMNTFLVNEEKLRNADAVFFVGDVFDRLSALGSRDVYATFSFFRDFFDLCNKWDIRIIRFLEGTPSHDWGQSRVLPLLSEHDLDIRYVPTLSIERIESLGIDVLYLPDEHTHDVDKTLKDVKSLMVENGLDRVDIICMHGQFAYQLPIVMPSMQIHNKEAYEQLVRYYISIGHIHTYNPNGKILPAGSSDRIRHGEEEDKGFCYCEIDKDKETWEHEFIINHDACIFDTVDVNEGTSIDVIDELILKYRPGSHIRLRGPSKSPLLKNIRELSYRHKHLILTKIATDDSETRKMPVKKDYPEISVNESNLPKLLKTRLRNMSPDISDLALEYIQEFL